MPKVVLWWSVNSNFLRDADSKAGISLAGVDFSDLKFRVACLESKRSLLALRVGYLSSLVLGVDACIKE